MDESTASARMNQYERGRHTPELKALKLIADELNVPLSYFFCEDELSAELVTNLNKLPEDEKWKVLELTKSLLARIGDDTE